MIKLNISPCPNDTFMFDAIINRRIDLCGLEFEVEYCDIEELNSRVLRGTPDVSKISCAILPSIEANYHLCGSGAALGRGNGPLLVRPAGATTPIRRVAVPGLQTTATALLRRFFPEIESVTPVLFSEIATLVERGEFDAGILIHEGRFVYQQQNLELIADLGVLWEESTQLPLPLGGIVMRKSLFEGDYSCFEMLLRRSIEYAFTHPAISRQYIKEHAQELDDTVIESHIALFVNEYSLDLGADGHRAIEELLYPNVKLK